jgi:hypothetical protein
MMTASPTEILLTIEIGTAGVASTFAAFSMGLQRIDALMGVFFALTLLGQLTTAMLQKMRPLPGRSD